MKENQFFWQGACGCLISLVNILLAICAVVISAIYHYPEHPFCRGMLGAGFPVLFICDNWGGGSPTGSWGKIDFVDVLNGGIRPGGFLVDFLFYTILIWIIWFMTSRIFHKRVNRRELWWTTFIIIGFVSGFLFAFLTFQSSDLHIRDSYVATPAPVIPPTPLETRSSIITPIATLTIR